MLQVSTVKLKYFIAVPINKNSDTLAITDFYIKKKTQNFNVMNLKYFGENVSSTTKKLKKKINIKCVKFIYLINKANSYVIFARYRLIISPWIGHSFCLNTVTVRA